MLTQEINAAQPVRMAQGGNNADKTMIASFDIQHSSFASLPGQLFYSTQIPVRLWFLAKNKNADAKRGFRDRRQPVAPAHSTP